MKRNQINLLFLFLNIYKMLKDNQQPFDPKENPISNNTQVQTNASTLSLNSDQKIDNTLTKPISSQSNTFDNQSQHQAKINLPMKNPNQSKLTQPINNVSQIDKSDDSQTNQIIQPNIQQNLQTQPSLQIPTIPQIQQKSLQNAQTNDQFNNQNQSNLINPKLNNNDNYPNSNYNTLQQQQTNDAQTTIQNINQKQQITKQNQPLNINTPNVNTFKNVVQQTIAQSQNQYSQNKDNQNIQTQDTMFTFDDLKDTIEQTTGLDLFSQFDPTSLLLQTDENVQNDKTDIELDQYYSISNQQMTYQMPKNLESNKFYVIETQGVGQISLMIFFKSNDKYPYKQKIITLNSIQKKAYIPLDQVLNFKGRLLSIRKVSQGMMNQFIFKLLIKDHLEIDFNGETKIYSFFSNQILFKVMNPQKVAKIDKDNRIQFIVSTSLDTQKIGGGEELEMYINKRKSYPNPTDFDMKASGSLGYGLIKTVSKQNQYYCIQEECDYYVTLIMNKVDFFNFFPTIMANGSQLKFNNYLMLIEELEVGESVEYELVVPKIEGNWVFSIMPIEGNPHFFINPDTKPNTIQDYKYQAEANGPEDIVITHKESEEFGFSYEKFYVKYQSKDPQQVSTFKFEAHRYQLNERYFIHINHSENGVVAQNEVVNYYVNMFSKDPETFNINFNLKSTNGKADIFVKECLANDTKCQITVHDVNNSYLPNYQIYYTNKLFRFSKNVVDKNQKIIEDNLLLNVNCAGTKYMNNQDAQKTFKNKFPVSQSCIFVIGIFGRDKYNKYGAFYRMTVKGQESNQKLQIENSVSFTIGPKENINFIVPISEYNKIQAEKVHFKIIAITGKCNIYVSCTNKHPNQYDYDGKLEVKDESLVSLHTASYDLFLNIQDNLRPSEIYISIQGIEYSILDMYVDFNYLNVLSNKQTEKIKLTQLLTRQITTKQMLKIEEGKVYYRSFIFEIPNIQKRIYKQLQVILNSFVVGLKICIQMNIKKYNPDKECVFETTSDILLIGDDVIEYKEGDKLLISILKETDLEVDIVKNFPIEFTISINSLYSLDKLEILGAGKTYTAHLAPLQSLTLSLNLDQMQDNALIIISSSDPTVQAILSMDSKHPAQFRQLDFFIYGIRINNAKHFKRKFCQDKCSMIVEIFTMSDLNHRFSLTYTVDDIPITLKEGVNISVPDNFDQYFLYEAKDDESLSLNVKSNHTKIVSYAKLFHDYELKHTMLPSQLSEEKSDFKTSIEQSDQIVIPSKILKRYKPPIIGYYIVPKFIDNINENLIEYLDSSRQVKVVVHQKILQLEAFNNIQDTVNEGEFKYYYIHLDELEDFSIFLNVNSGEADLYLNKGVKNMPTLKSYWKKSATYKSDTMVIKKNLLEKAQNQSFTVGIYGREHGDYSILYMPNFKNLIKVQYQQLISMELEKNQFYYFDFFNLHKIYNTLIYAENSDIEISALNYDEHMNQNFDQMIENEKNYIQKFTFKKGDIPRKHLSDDAVSLQSHIVVRMKALEGIANIDFIIYDKDKPIQAYSEKRFSFVQDKDEQTIFIIKLNNKYEEVDLDIKLNFGSIEIAINDDPVFKDYTSINLPSQKYLTYKVKSKEDIIIFNEVYVSVKSSQFSQYSILAKPKDKFKELKEHQTEIIYTDKENDQYIFYYINDKRLKFVKYFQMEIMTNKLYGDKPKFLFMPDGDDPLNKDSPFIPMNIIDMIDGGNEEFHTLSVRPQINKGFYVIKINKNKKRFPIKVSLSINNHRHLELNGLYWGYIPANKLLSPEYSMYLPEKGEFRVVLESCSDISIKNAVFTHLGKNKNIEFVDNTVQSYNYLKVDETGSKVKRQYVTVTYPVKFGLVDNPGSLKFNISPQRSLSNHKRINYNLISEFRPDNKNLMLKDYVNMWQDQEKFNNRKFTYSFLDHNKKLQIKTKLPKFKEQLFLDYPKMKKVEIRFYYYLFDNDDFQERLNQCGMMAVETLDAHKRYDVRIIDVKVLNKDKKQDIIQFYFYESELKKFKNSSKLNVFSYISISFYEQQEDYFNISLNYKFTTVPFFLLTIPNQYTQAYPIFTSLLIGISITLVLIIFIIYMVRMRDQKIQTHTYQKGGQHEITKLDIQEKKIDPQI